MEAAGSKTTHGAAGLAVDVSALVQQLSTRACVIGPDGLIRVVNRAWCQPYGVEPEAAVGTPLVDWLPHGHNEMLDARISRAVGSHEPSTWMWEWPAADGSLVAEHWTDHPLVVDGRLTEIVSIAADVSEMRAAFHATSRAERWFRSLVGVAAEALVVLDGTGVIRYCTPATGPVLGASPEEVLDRPMVELIAEEQRGSLSQLIEVGAGSMVVEMLQDAERHVELSVSDMREDPVVGGLVLSARDVSSRIRAEVALRDQAQVDPLTKLPNRRSLETRVEEAVARAGRTDRLVALLFIDLDRFKIVNDSLGHAAGDALLVEVARRIQSCCRLGETVARLGGDEFVAVLENVRTRTEAVGVAERIVADVQQPVDVGGAEAFVGASVGIVVGGPGDTATSMLRDADTAMYRAKDLGRGRCVVFDVGMQQWADERVRTEVELRHVIERDELVLHYEPQIHLETGELLGFEALARWNHPERGMVPPTLFIPVAEEIGAIGAIGNWAVAEACRQLAEWRRRYGQVARNLRMSVNVSGLQITQRAFVDTVRSILGSTRDIDPHNLVLELTETALVKDPEASQARIRELRELGVTVAIDDFGVGYSSLAYLKDFPISEIKIDRAFTSNLGRSNTDTTIVGSVIRLAEALHIDVIGEGIETAEQMGILLDLDCRKGQGWLFQRATPAAEVGSLIEARRLPPRRDLRFRGSPGVRSRTLMS